MQYLKTLALGFVLGLVIFVPAAFAHEQECQDRPNGHTLCVFHHFDMVFTSADEFEIFLTENDLTLVGQTPVTTENPVGVPVGSVVFFYARGEEGEIWHVALMPDQLGPVLVARTFPTETPGEDA